MGLLDLIDEVRKLKAVIKEKDKKIEEEWKIWNSTQGWMTW